MKELDFYFDYLSPYAYLASLEVPELCRRHGARLRLRPVLFAGLLNHWGQKGPAEVPPKGRNAMNECLRYAVLRDIPLCTPRHHPFRPLTALRLSLPEVSGDDQPGVIRALFAHGWAAGGHLGDDGELARALADAGYDGDALVARTRDPEVKKVLHQETAAAVERGVFGIPTLLVDDELFWGLSQLPHVELYLEGRDPLASIDRGERVQNQGATAWRTGVPRPPGAPPGRPA